MTDFNKLKNETIIPAITFLEESLHVIERKYSKPEFIDEKGRRQWRYLKPNRFHVCIMKFVRIISGLNSMIPLLENGFYSEVFVILRTIEEFQHDVLFLLENLDEKEMSKHQKKYIEEFLKPGFSDPSDLFSGTPKREMIKRDKIEAAVARTLYIKNPTDLKKSIALCTDILSGYVHANYHSIMESYGGPPPDSKFHMNGLKESPLFIGRLKYYLLYIEKTYNCMMFLSNASGCYHQSKLLSEKLKALQKKTNSFGIDHETDPVKMLNSLKAGKR